MIRIIDENVFDSKAECIINTVNCVGFMGKGLAFEFALRYPELEQKYIDQCKRHIVHTGILYFYEVNGQKIINFPTKFHFKYPSKIEWIEQGLDYFVANYKRWNIKSVAFPLLGARNGGLNPREVIELMKRKLEKVDIEVFICLNKKPDSLSLLLLSRLQKCNIYSMAKELKLNAKQINVLVAAKDKIKNFHEIADLPSIGSETYKKIFNFLQNDNGEQILLF